jgi:hypothetical protein
VPITKAARHLGLTIDQFRAKLPELYRRNFPAPDPTTGMFDLEAIGRWQNNRHPHLFETAGPESPAEARMLAEERLARL